MEVTLVPSSNSNNMYISQINDIHLYLFILTIVIIALSTLCFYLNSRLNKLEYKNKIIYSWLDRLKCNIDVLILENNQLKNKVENDITKNSNILNELCDAIHNYKIDHTYLMDTTNQLNDALCSFQHAQNLLSKSVEELKNERTDMIEKMDKIIQIV